MIAFSETPDDPRSRLITAARAHFFGRGFRSVTMDDLAAELGVSKKTLYSHFDSKTALLEAVVLQKLGEVEQTFGAILTDPAAGFAAKLERLMDCQRKHFSELQPAFIHDMRRDAPELFRLIEERRRRLIPEFFGPLLKEGRTAGLIRKDVPLDIVVETLLAAAEALCTPAKFEETNRTPPETYAAILTIVLEGVLVKQGNK